MLGYDNVDKEIQVPIKVAEYRSKSDPNKVYNIIQDKHGTFYCNCWQWKKKRTCSHLEHFLASVKPQSEDVELSEAIEKAVANLR